MGFSIILILILLFILVSGPIMIVIEELEKREIIKL